MANTTISVSEKFHEWLKGKGRKGESYEDVIKKMLKQEFLKEVEHESVPIKVQSSKPKRTDDEMKDVKELARKLDVVSRESKTKPKKEKAMKSQKGNKPLSKIEKAKASTKSKLANESQKPKVQSALKNINPDVLKKSSTKSKPTKTNDDIKQLRNEKNLELQRLEVELELAKLSNDVGKVKELPVLISKLKQELQQNRS